MVEVELNQLKGKKGIDLKSLNMKKSKIQIVKVLDNSNEEGENFSLMIQTEIVKEGTKLRGTEFINLFRDDEGNLCYSLNENSKAKKILDYFRVDNFQDLIGMECELIVKIRNKRETLGIYYGA